MSDSRKEAEEKMAKAIFISGDGWLSVFDLLAPSQLGLGIALISHRFDFYVDEHFKTRKWTLRNIRIGRRIGENGTNEMVIVNLDGKALPIAQMQLPRKVIGFRRITITHFPMLVHPPLSLSSFGFVRHILLIAFDQTNELTREQLALKSTDYRRRFLLIRCPIERDASKWAKWEEEANVWEIYTQWNRIGIQITSERDIGDRLLNATPGPSDHRSE